jgi:GNAT superfamily N-acetyltransferase
VNTVAVSERVSLVEAVEGDAERLAEISKRAFDSDVEAGASGPGGPPGYDSPEAYARLMRYLESYLILLEDSVVGAMMVGSRGEEHRVFERIFVDPEHQNRGIGTRAFELLWELYPGVKLWTLGTPEWNVRTEHFYEKLGFVQVGWDLADPKTRGRWYEKAMDPSDHFETARIGELRDGMRDVTVEGEVLEKSMARTVRSRRRGETLNVANAAIGDETGRVVLVLWNEQIRQASVGDRVRVEFGYVTSYRGVTQLNVGRAGRLIKLI